MPMELAHLLVRQAEDAAEEETGCSTTNEYDGRLGLRVSSIFVILIGSTLGGLDQVRHWLDSDRE